MSQQPQPQKPQQPVISDPRNSGTERREWIPVAMLKFSDREPIDIPGIGGKSSVTGSLQELVVDANGKRKPGSHWVIHFSTSMRHHRVVYFPPEAQRAPIVRMIHETHIRTWEPFE